MTGRVHTEFPYGGPQPVLPNLRPAVPRRGAAVGDLFLWTLYAVSLALASRVNSTWEIDCIFSLSIGLILCRGLLRPKAVAALARPLGSSFLLFSTLFALTALRSLFSAVPLETVITHFAVSLPLLLGPVFGAALGRDQRSRKILGQTILFVALGYATVTVAAALVLGVALTRYEISRGVPLMFYGIAPAIAVRIIEDHRSSKAKRFYAVFAFAVCGLALIITGHRSLFAISMLLILFSIARSLSRGKVLRLAGVTVLVTSFGIVGFYTMGSYLDLLLERFSATKISVEESPRLQESWAVLHEVWNSPRALLIGKGLGSEYEYLRTVEYSFLWRGRYTHNILTYFLLAGGAGLSLAAGWFFLRIWRLSRIARSRFKNTAETLGMLDSIPISLIYFTLFSGNSTVYAPLLAGILIGVMCITLYDVPMRAARARSA